MLDMYIYMYTQLISLQAIHVQVVHSHNSFKAKKTMDLFLPCWQEVCLTQWICCAITYKVYGAHVM